MFDILFWPGVVLLALAVVAAVSSSRRSSSEHDEDPTVALIREVIVEEAPTLAVAIAEALAHNRIHS